MRCISVFFCLSLVYLYADKRSLTRLSMHPLVASTPARPGRGDTKRAWGGNSAHAVPVLCVLPHGYLATSLPFKPSQDTRAHAHLHREEQQLSSTRSVTSTYSISTSADVRERGSQRMSAHPHTQPQIHHVNSCRRATRFGVVDREPPTRTPGRHAVRGTESLTVHPTEQNGSFAAKTIDSRHDPHVPRGDSASGGRAHG